MKEGENCIHLLMWSHVSFGELKNIMSNSSVPSKFTHSLDYKVSTRYTNTHKI